MRFRESFDRLQLDDDPIFDENISIEGTNNIISIMDFDRVLFMSLQTLRAKLQNQSLFVNTFEEPGPKNRKYPIRTPYYFL